MILDLNEREQETLKNLTVIKNICNDIKRRFEKGSTKFLIEDIEDIKTILNFIAKDNFNRRSNEW